jgi:hypothetical protein
MKGRVMTRIQQDQSSLNRFPHAVAEAKLDDFAAELAEAAFPVVLQHGAGGDWLERKLELWNAMTQTVRKWQQQASLSL